MNRTWSVWTIPYLVLTVEPSTIGKRSRCTPSRETSGPPCMPSRPGDLVDLVDEDDAGMLDAMHRLLGHRFHVDQPDRLFRRNGRLVFGQRRIRSLYVNSAAF